MKPAFGIAAAALLAALPAAAQDAGTAAAVEIDPQAYSGTWFEIARTPTPFQEQCTGGVTASYEPTDSETIQVTNRCDTAGGQTQSVTGEAEVVDGNFNTFDVQFAAGDESRGVNYVVVAASDIEDGQYQWAAVHSPPAGTGWILSRAPQIDAEDRQQAETALRQAGVDLAQLSDTAQPPQSYQVAQ